MLEKLCCATLFLFLSACEKDPPTATPPAPPAQPVAPPSAPAVVTSATPMVSAARLLNPETEDWLSHGRTYSEQRYSPLTQINDKNIGELGLAWYVDLASTRGIEATPLVADGVMYTTESWSVVHALDAGTGEQLWQYDPEVPRTSGAFACCDVVNRGVALWQDKLFVGTIDGRLIALDSATGSPVWDVQTTDPQQPYTITGALRVMKGKVVIGNGGAEYGVRGYVSAYDADTGELVWRFYTVPGDPSLPFESAAMERAAETWTGEWWTMGGGGTVWDSMAYDPELDLLYVGVGNGSPWDRKLRSPGGGDNLFLASIVALKADTGEYVWHYQTTPGETWDYTATQHMILADLQMEGEVRKVIMQAPKNGFFYVLDRATGEFISAKPYVPVDWATHIDAQGRPVESAGVRERADPRLTKPSPMGGHNWQPMAYSPGTGLVYIPAADLAFPYLEDPGFQYKPGVTNTGLDHATMSMPEDPRVQQAVLETLSGSLIAWDPIAQKQAWRVPHSSPWNGGILATAGNLLFQGRAKGEFVAYRADTGERQWSMNAQSGVLAAPVTYALDGEQYVTVMVGWGTAYGLISGRLARSLNVANVSRVLTFKLGGTETLPALAELASTNPKQPPASAPAETVATGKKLFHRFCFGCHGEAAISGSSLPDLRYMTAGTHAQWIPIVLGGLRQARGMVGYADYLSAEDADAIHAYVIKRAHDEDKP